MWNEYVKFVVSEVINLEGNYMNLQRRGNMKLEDLREC